MAGHRRAPVTIPHFAAGGSTLESGTHLGTVAANLQGKLREFQVYEAVQKIVDGDPQGFLTMSKPLLDKLNKKDPLYLLLAGYVDKATAKVKQMGEDSEAYSAYAKTNNHQQMLDYVIQRMKTTTDPAELAHFETQSNELRQRIFRASAGAAQYGNSGVSKQDLQDARDAWDGVQAKISTKLRAGETITDGDVSDATKAAQDLSKMLIAVEHSNAPDSARRGAFTMRAKADGPQDGVNIPWLANAKATSDKNLVSQFESDSKTVTQKDIDSAGSPAEKVKLAAQRANQSQYLATHALTKDGQIAAGKIIQSAEADIDKNTRLAGDESAKLPPGAQKNVDSAYETYAAAYQEKFKSEQGMLSASAFARSLATAPDRATLDTVLRVSMPWSSDADYNEYKVDASAKGPAAWDDTTQSFVGSKEQVKSANDLAEGLQLAAGLPNSPVAAKYGIVDPTQMGKKDWLSIANGTWQGQTQFGPTSTLNQGPWGPGGERDESTRAAAMAASTDGGMSNGPKPPLEALVPGAHATDEDLAPSPSSQNESRSEFDTIIQGADNRLKSFEPNDLPPGLPEATPQPNYEDLNLPERPPFNRGAF